MKTIIATVAFATLSANIAFADAHGASDEDCMNMLTAAVGNELSAQGIDTTNICDLSLNDVATIKALLDEDGMNASSVGRINHILGN